MAAGLNKTPADRVCATCNAILRWRGTAIRGQYRHSRSNGELYITTHAPAPRPSLDDAAPQGGYTPCACRDCMDIAISAEMRGAYGGPALCLPCMEAGCEMSHDGDTGAMYDCQRASAYGSDC